MNPQNLPINEVFIGGKYGEAHRWHFPCLTARLPINSCSCHILTSFKKTCGESLSAFGALGDPRLLLKSGKPIEDEDKWAE